MEWNVPDHGKRTCMASSPTMRLARRVISTAARREKVRSRMRCGLAPPSTRCATRCASVFVLPVPAPARISSAPSPWHAAARCAAFSFLNLSVTSTEGDYRLLLYILPVTVKFGDEAKRLADGNRAGADYGPRTHLLVYGPRHVPPQPRRPCLDEDCLGGW